MNQPDQPAFRPALRSSGAAEHDVVPRLDRRGLLAACAALGFSRVLPSLQASIGPAPKDLNVEIDPGAMLTRLVRRITYAPTPEELGLAQSLGYEAYLERHLDPISIDDSEMIQRTPAVLLWEFPPRVLANDYGPDALIPLIIDTTILRAAIGKRQLLERMCEFWSDHFNLYLLDEEQYVLQPVNYRAIVRTHAFASFPALLQSMMQSPAMLAFLDNNLNVAGVVNENYARELMELHTMGVDGGYTQQDVIEIARCLTGWTYNPYTTNVNDYSYGLFRFDAARHDNGQKTVLGNIIAAGGGQQDGIKVAQILAGHPSTAKFISQKMCAWFLGENPPQGVVDSVTSTYTATGGDIKAMIRKALHPDALYQARPKLKRPFHFVVSMLRGLQANFVGTSAARYWLDSSGHLPFHWGPPSGYPDSFDYWASSLLPRWNWGGQFGANQIQDINIDVPTLFAGANTAETTAERINQLLYSGEMPAYDKQRVTAYLAAGTLNPYRYRAGIGLALASPSFQVY